MYTIYTVSCLFIFYRDIPTVCRLYRDYTEGEFYSNLLVQLCDIIAFPGLILGTNMKKKKYSFTF